MTCFRVRRMLRARGWLRAALWRGECSFTPVQPPLKHCMQTSRPVGSSFNSDNSLISCHDKRGVTAGGGQDAAGWCTACNIKLTIESKHCVQSSRYTEWAGVGGLRAATAIQGEQLVRMPVLGVALTDGLDVGARHLKSRRCSGLYESEENREIDPASGREGQGGMIAAYFPNFQRENATM